MSGETENPVVVFFRTAVGVVFAIAFLGGMLWVSGFFSLFGGPGAFGETVGYSDEFIRAHEKEQQGFVETVEEAPVDAPPVSTSWSCGWSPTMNENWHDDVLCVRGGESVRPSLLADWDFVTQQDMMTAAADFETYLNSKTGTTAEDGFRAPVFTGP